MHPTTKSEAYCNKCGASTNHFVEHRFKRDWEEVISDSEWWPITIDGWDIWETLRCLGCDTVYLRHNTYFSEDNSGPNLEPTVQVAHYPPRLTRRKAAFHTQMFPLSLDVRDHLELLDEIYDAMSAGAMRLAAMGIRALAERVMVDKVSDQGSFKANISAFFHAGYVAKQQQTTFEETLIEAGHAAMHRGFNPTHETIETLLDIIEPLLDDIYFKPLRTAQAAKTIPKKKPKAKRIKPPSTT